MDCSEYREKYEKFARPVPLEIFQSEEFSEEFYEYTHHLHTCIECSDWTLAQRIKKRGHNPESFPCVHIGDYLTQTCDGHPNPRDCPDILVVYNPIHDEYTIPIRDGENCTSLSGVIIRYCPWCGVQLPEPKGHRWFQELEALGYDDPWDQDIPVEYLSDKWYKKTD